MSNFIINFTRAVFLLILCVNFNISFAMDEVSSDTASSSQGSLKRRRSNDSLISEEGIIDNVGTFESTAGSDTDSRLKSLLTHPGFTFTPTPKATISYKKPAVGIERFLDKENHHRVNGRSSLEGAWYQKTDTGNWVLNLGNSTYATVIPGRVAELLFGSNAYTKGAVFMIYGTEEAKKTAEDMAKAERLPFSKKKASAARKNLFIKRR